MMPHNLLQYGVVAFVTLAVAISHSAGYELRPSEHGLANQRGASSPAYQDGDPKQMLSFFNSTTTTTPDTPLPEAQSIGGDSWRGDRRGGSVDLRRDHVRLGLLAAAVICGFAGAVLLAVSGVVYLRRRRREKAGDEVLSSNLKIHEKELAAQP